MDVLFDEVGANGNGGSGSFTCAAWGAVGGAGAAIGVLVGGVLTEFTDWRMIFYVNLRVPAARSRLPLVPADTQTPSWRGRDLRGAVLATTSLAAIVFAITQADNVGWASPQTLPVGLSGVVGLAGFAVCERQTDAPLLRIERLADRAVGGGLFPTLAAAGSIFGPFLLSSLYLQNVLNMGPLATGGRRWAATTVMSQLRAARARRRGRVRPAKSRPPCGRCSAGASRRSSG